MRINYYSRLRGILLLLMQDKTALFLFNIQPEDIAGFDLI
jgi:hypothetical protein